MNVGPGGLIPKTIGGSTGIRCPRIRAGRFTGWPLPGLPTLLVGDRAFVECTVRLYHRSVPGKAVVVFEANGREVARRELPIPTEPELLTLAAQWETRGDTWLSGQVRLDGEPDALSADDRVHFSLPPIREGRAVLVASSPYLQAALSPDVMVGR